MSRKSSMSQSGVFETSCGPTKSGPGRARRIAVIRDVRTLTRPRRDDGAAPPRLTPIAEKLRDPAFVVGVTIGNFDGFHLGHRALVRTLSEELERDADATGRIPVKTLMTFAPHPRAVLAGLSRSERRSSDRFRVLSPVRDRIAQAALQGIDLAFVVRFTRAFASLSPEEFFVKYVVEAVRAEIVVVGDDWSFGRGRSGTTSTLRELGERYGVSVLIHAEVEEQGRRISSSAVREAIVVGDLRTAESLLGRPYTLSGRVRHGNKVGRAIGFPTANIVPVEQVLPPNGVYAARVYHRGVMHPAAVNIGTRPTVGGQGLLVEAHLLDGSYDLYGSRIEVALVEWLRDEEKFGSLEELKAAIADDIVRTRAVLGA